jgi:hypothetical protein
MEWWVTHGDRKPIGPVTTELLLQGIGADMIPRDALVCEVGGTTWKPILKVPPFSIALDDRHRRRRMDSEYEPTIVDAPSDEEGLGRFDEVVEHTIVDRPRTHSSIPPRLPTRLDQFDDADDKTVTDAAPLPSREEKDEE